MTETERRTRDRLADLANKAERADKWDAVEPLVRQAMAIEEATLGPNHPEVAGSLSWIASTYEARDRPVEAEALLRRALQINRATLGDDHPDTARVSSRLGANLGLQHRDVEAEPLLRRSLAIWRAAVGEADLRTAKANLDLANDLAGQNRFEDAQPFYRTGADMRLALLGARNLKTAEAYMGLGANLVRLGRIQEAEEALRTAFDARRALLGEDDPETAANAEYLGVCLDRLGRYVEAEPLLRKALDVSRRTPGRPQRGVSWAYNNLAFNLTAQGRYAEADPLYRTALEIHQRLFGERSSETATSYTNIAANLKDQGRHPEAEPLFRKALAIRLAVLGDHDLETAAAYHNLAGELVDQGRSLEAIGLLDKALAIERDAPGGYNPTSLDLLAYLLNGPGGYEKAEAYLREALRIRLARLGEQHPETAGSYSHLAIVLDHEGKASEAEPYHRKALDLHRRLLGERHPETARSYAVLATSLADQSRFAEAEPLAAKAVEIARTLRQQERGASQGGGLRYDQLTDDAPFRAELNAAWGLAAAAPQALPRLRAAAFTVAQDLDASAAGEAMSQAAARVAAGQVGLGETVRRREDVSAAMRRDDARLLQALGSVDTAAATELRDQIARAGAQAAQLDAQIRKQFPRYAELISPRPLELAEAQARLRPGEGALLIVPAGDDLHIFALSPGKVAWWRAAGAAKTTQAAVSALLCQTDPATCLKPEARGARGLTRASVSAGVRPFDRALAYGLYRDLLAPVEGAFDGVHTLFVTTPGPLGALPLGLLVTEPSGAGEAASAKTLASTAWLADKYALVTLPTLSSLRALGALHPESGRVAFSGFGDPDLRGAVGRGTGRGAPIFRGRVEAGQPIADVAALRASLPPLPGTRIELQAMASALGAPVSTVRLGPRATEAAVKRDTNLAQSRVVVFATHGLLPHEMLGVEEPGLVFTPPATPSAEDDGVLTASEAARLSLSADWLILSACNTAASDGAPGAESLSGLAKAFLYAGARALLASHWRVQDDATAALTVETLTLQRAHPDWNKAEALQAAMKAVRTGVLPNGEHLVGWKPKWAHPSAWAPFSLIAADP